MFELRYIPGSPYGAKFPLWRFGQRTTRESADATRMQCATPDQIEVVECGESPDRVGDSGSAQGRMWPTTKAAPAVLAHCDSGASPTIKESTDG